MVFFSKTNNYSFERPSCKEAKDEHTPKDDLRNEGVGDATNSQSPPRCHIVKYFYKNVLDIYSWDRKSEIANSPSTQRCILGE